MDEPMKEDRSWLPAGTIDVGNEAEVRAWASRLHVTAGELREMLEEDARHIPRPRDADRPETSQDQHTPRP